MKIHSSSGFSLIEVSIAMFILALLLLGFDATQLATLKTTRENQTIALAIQQIANLTETMQVAEPSERTQRINEWINEIQQQFPHGNGTVEGEWPLINISLCWDQSRGVLSGKKTKCVHT